MSHFWLVKDCMNKSLVWIVSAFIPLLVKKRLMGLGSFEKLF